MTVQHSNGAHYLMPKNNFAVALETEDLTPIVRRIAILENGMEQNETNNETNPQIEPQPGSTGAPEVMPSQEEMLKEAERKAQEHYDAWMYAKAEGENIRRRAVEDVSKAHKFAVERFSNEMLAVKDSLEAGLAVEAATVESFKSGMQLTLKQLSGVFEKFNIQRDQPSRRKVRCAQAPGHRHAGQ